MLKKSERIAVYEWVEEHKDDKGLEYPIVLDCTHCDYVTIRQKLRKYYPYADYEIVENNRDQKYVKVFIKSN
jgi:hypothetical protein